MFLNCHFSTFYYEKSFVLCLNVKSSITKIQQGHFCFKQMMEFECLHIEHKHLFCRFFLFFLIFMRMMRQIQNKNKNRPIAKKIKEDLILIFKATNKIPNKVHPIPVQKGQYGYLLVKMYESLLIFIFFQFQLNLNFVKPN